jgi:hypothetical protein
VAVTEVIAQIDAEISKLQRARALLTGVETVAKTGRGRPKGSKNGSAGKAAAPASTPAKSKRRLSPEGRKAIADAMKRRWAEKRKVAAK